MRGSIRSENALRDSAIQISESGPVSGRRHDQAPAGAKHPANLRQPGCGVGDVLHHLPGPHHVEGGVLELPRAVRLDHQRRQTRVGPPGACERLRGDVDGQHLGARAQQLGGERPLTASDIQDAVAGLDAGEQEVASHGEPLGLESLGQRLPDRLLAGAG